MKVSLRRSVKKHTCVGQNSGVKFERLSDNCSLLISKSNKVVQNKWKSYLKQRNNAWRSIQRKSAPGYPNKHTWREKWLTVISEENLDSSNGILNDKRTIDLPIFCFSGAPAKNRMVQSILVEYILCLTERQKHYWVWIDEFLELLGQEWRKSAVSCIFSITRYLKYWNA